MDRQGDALHRLGRRIARLREQRQMTPEILAARIGIDPAELTAIEAGQIDIPITTIFRLAKAFGITADQFLDFPQ